MKLLDIEHHEYNATWRVWKIGSLWLFAIFVATFIDVARTLRRMEESRRDTFHDYSVPLPTSADLEDLDLVEASS